MLPRLARADRKLLDQIFSKEGRASYTSKRNTGGTAQLTVVTYPSAHAKTAFVVSSSVMKRAVDRNRTKRRARAIVARVYKKLPQGRVFIFFLSTRARAASFADLESDILNLLNPYLLPTTCLPVRQAYY